MSETTWPPLIAAAAFLGVTHTLAGPDHYVPFVAMSRAGNWSARKTLLVTVLCGVGHVSGSVWLGLLGAAMGWSLGRLTFVEDFRGSLAGWLLIGFGAAYAVWGWRRASRGKTHRHRHVHEDGTIHEHEHDHFAEHAHVHSSTAGQPALTPWVLFTIFVFGPCEPLIPLLLTAGALHGSWLIAGTVIVFGACTIATMTTIVMLARAGLFRFSFPRLQRHFHTLAGTTAVLCGLAVRLGL